VTEIGQGRRLHGKRHLSLRDLLQNELEDVLNILQREGVPEDLPQQEFRHVSQHNLVLAHERFEKNLVNLIVGTPGITDDVVCNGGNELIMYVVSCTLILQVRVGIGGHTLGVVELHVYLVSS
jgi:hypothetical protein